MIKTQVSPNTHIWLTLDHKMSCHKMYAKIQPMETALPFHGKWTEVILKSYGAME